MQNGGIHLTTTSIPVVIPDGLFVITVRWGFRSSAAKRVILRQKED
jgi:hypothetical protein